jgi:hypothetical protein
MIFVAGALGLGGYAVWRWRNSILVKEAHAAEKAEKEKKTEQVTAQSAAAAPSTAAVTQTPTPTPAPMAPTPAPMTPMVSTPAPKPPAVTQTPTPAPAVTQTPTPAPAVQATTPGPVTPVATLATPAPLVLTRPPPSTTTTPPAIEIGIGQGPKTPLPQPKHPKLRQRINRSSETATVRESPPSLLVQALRFDPRTTLDELTGARLAASEHGSGSFTELACIVDSELNRAKRRGKSLFDSLTHNGTFGSQGLTRRASTKRDPLMRHLLAARAVLSGPARGVSRGAVQFFDPRDMNRLNARYLAWVAGGRVGKRPSIVTCDALGLLEAWSFAHPPKDKEGPRCPVDRSRMGSYTLAWVGPIPGVNPWRLMLMERMKPGPKHTRRYEAAREFLMSKTGKG